MGRASDHWMARLSSPHYGGYTTLAVVNGSPQGPIIVVVVVGPLRGLPACLRAGQVVSGGHIVCVCAAFAGVQLLSCCTGGWVGPLTAEVK